MLATERARSAGALRAADGKEATIQIPLELTFRGFEPPPRMEAKIRQKADRLERFYDRITGCRVAVEKPHEHADSGNPYRVRIDITVPPGHEIVARKEPGDQDFHEDLETVLNSAFQAAERQLKELKRRQRREVKTHAEPIGFVVRLFKEQGYGFIEAEQGSREIYFHRNSVVGNGWDRLTVGTQVRVVAAMGEEGPQASTVKILDKPGGRAEKVDEHAEAAEAPLGWEDAEESRAGAG